METTVPSFVLDAASSAKRITVLTGAGMSAESGVPTFRDAQTGLWEQFDSEALATPQAWDADTDFVWACYVWRMALVRRVSPNAGHIALARWQAVSDLRIATQNVDDLHERAGSEVLTHVHGSLFASRCSGCEAPYDAEIDLPDEPFERITPPVCPGCGGAVRPGVVWFGENLPEGSFDSAVDAVTDSDLVLVVGTSGMVYPFAALPEIARGGGARVVEINPNETALSRSLDFSWQEGAAIALPALVDALGIP